MQPALPTELPGLDDNVGPSRQRLFIARQACKRCQTKKTRCDGGNPCSQCRDAGESCVFGERKATKNEISLGMVFNALRRIETKVEKALANPPAAGTAGPSNKRRRSLSGGVTSLESTSPTMSRDGERYGDVSDPYETSPHADPTFSAATGPSPHSQPHKRESIPYAVRQVLLWPAVKAMLAETRGGSLPDPGYATTLEQQRPDLPPPSPGALGAADDMTWLRISLVKPLADAYFATYNLANPILDRKLFGQQTLGTAVNSAFGYNMESCVVLAVMALGCLGLRALREGGFSGEAMDVDTGGAGGVGAEDGVPGLAFFNESRKRIGFLACENSIHACQYYLLSGLFYAHLNRPLEWWAMVNRASLCCAAFWESIPQDRSEWIMDMQSRLFWNTVMHEAVLTQELDVPVSNLIQYEDKVPLPRFIEFPAMMFVQPVDPETEAQESICQYHFLAQIAHRIILTRVRNAMFSAPGSATPAFIRAEDYPPRAVEDELIHQFEQWRQKLPPSLQWRDDDEEIVVQPPSTPVDVIVSPWLRSRYHIARYHLRRPLFHRVLHHPDSVTEHDVEKCNEALQCVMKWTTFMKSALTMESCLPLKFFICNQIFGMILIIEALGRSADRRISQLVPANHEAWRSFALDTLKHHARSSPCVARDYDIVMRLVSASS